MIDLQDLADHCRDGISWLIGTDATTLSLDVLVVHVVAAAIAIGTTVSHTAPIWRPIVSAAIGWWIGRQR